MLFSTVILVNGNFVTIPETGRNSATIINKLLGKQSLKHLLS